MEPDPICPLCLRPIPPGARSSLHHLIPKLKGGARGPTVRLHHICHKEIHARLSEARIAREAASPESLRAHPAMRDFLLWIATKPPEFDARTLRSARRRRRR